MDARTYVRRTCVRRTYVRHTYVRFDVMHRVWITTGGGIAGCG